MKKILVIITATLSFTLTVLGQNLFLIGEHSYPCTKTFTLQSNSDEFYINDLNVLFAKDGEMALLGISTKTKDLVIHGKLIIYLDDGTVITLSDNGVYDYVDKIASAAYYLTDEDLGKMKNSNIIKVRYKLEKESGVKSHFGGKYSASNKGDSRMNFHSIIDEFYK